jgi:hypothetical protein
MSDEEIETDRSGDATIDMKNKIETPVELGVDRPGVKASLVVGWGSVVSSGGELKLPNDRDELVKTMRDMVFDELRREDDGGKSHLGFLAEKQNKTLKEMPVTMRIVRSG